MNGLGKSLIAAGLLLVAAGAVVLASSKAPFLGRLPGDIVIRKPGFSFYFPLGTSLLLSALLSLLLWLLRK